MNPRIDGREKALFFRGSTDVVGCKNSSAAAGAIDQRERERERERARGTGGGGERECGAETIVARSRPFEKASGAGNLRVREMHASVAAAAVRY